MKKPVYQSLSILVTGVSCLKLAGSPIMKSAKALPVFLPSNDHTP